MDYHLFPYQDMGADWLAATPHGGLFDEQGLGKTPQAIVAAERVNAQSVLVVCPTVVTYNWAREVARWSARFRAQVLATGRDRIDDDVNFVIVPYALLSRPAIQSQLFIRHWDVSIIDEAHFVKNPKTQRTKLVLGLSPQLNAPSIVARSKRAWLLTGTPMPNNPTELWAMLRSLAPQRLWVAGTRRPMTWHEFRNRYCELAHSSFTPDGVKVVGVKKEALPELRERLRGFSLRRLKTDHLDLPALRWGTVVVTAEQIPAELSELEQQMKGKSIDDLRESEHFSTWRRLCGIAKAPAVVDMLLDELESSPHKVVVFCHHTHVVNQLCAGLAGHGVVRITGDTPALERQRAVDAFQTDPTKLVCVAQIVAGGTGVTLTAAADVVFAELSWVPGENAQAADRCHRIGQTASVLARTIALAGSIDEMIVEALNRKRAMIRSVIGA